MSATDKPIPLRTNYAIFAGFLLLTAYCFLLLPLVLVPLSPWWLLTLAPAAFTANTLWYFTHESFHFMMHPDKDRNEIMGRMMAVCFGAPFDVVRFGHLQHHRFNGAVFDRTELYDPEETLRPVAAVKYYFTILGGLYLQEFVTYFVFFLGKDAVSTAIRRVFSGQKESEKALRQVALKQLATDKTVRRARVEGAAFFALLAAGLWAYGPWWPALVGFLLLRGALVSFANNLPHYATPADDVRYGLNVRLPKPLRLLYLNFNHHRQHHNNPTVPWVHLPAMMQEEEDGFDLPLAPAALAQFRGPIRMEKV